MKKYKVLVTDGAAAQKKFFEIEKEALPKIGAELIFSQCNTEDEVIEAAKGVDVILNVQAPVTKKVINTLDNCKVIVRYGVGVDTVDIGSATEKGIPVANVPNFCIEEVSTIAIALLLACARKLIPFNNSIKKGFWDKSIGGEVHSLKGKVFGLVGFGNIAKATARKAKAFNLDIVAYDPYLNKNEGQKYGVELVDFDTLLKNSDFISVHVPLTKETKYLFGKKEFSMMKKSAFFINTARGKVVNEKALYEALKEGQIMGAGLDVMEKEPVESDNPLLKVDNIILTPHVASFTEEAFTQLHVSVTQEVIRVLSGKLPLSLVNPQVKEKLTLS